MYCDYCTRFKIQQRIVDENGVTVEVDRARPYPGSRFLP